MSENSRLAQAILSQLAYITLSTTTKDGVPWNAPVYAAFDETYTFFWVSAKYARHSQNIRANHRIAIVVYDSTVPPGTGKQANVMVFVSTVHFSTPLSASPLDISR